MRELEGWIEHVVKARGGDAQPTTSVAPVAPVATAPSTKSDLNASASHSDDSPESLAKTPKISDPTRTRTPAGTAAKTPRTSEQQPAKAAAASASPIEAGTVPQATPALQKPKAAGQPDTQQSTLSTPSPTQESARPTTPRLPTKVSTPRGSERDLKAAVTPQAAHHVKRTPSASAVTKDEDAQEYDDDFDQDDNDRKIKSSV